MSRDIQHFRIEVQMANPNDAVVYLTRVPLSWDSLKQKAETWEIEVNGDRIPVTTCWMGSGDDAKKERSKKAMLMYQEPRDSSIGMGLLPIITQVFHSDNTGNYKPARPK